MVGSEVLLEGDPDEALGRPGGKAGRHALARNGTGAYTVVISLSAGCTDVR